MRGKSGDFCFHIDAVNKSRHWYFEPSPLFDIVSYLEMDAQLAALLIAAHRSLGILEGMVQSLPRMDCFEDMVIRNEVCMSCAVDNMDISYAVMMDNLINTVNKRFASNTVKATKALEKQPLTIELLCNLYGIIMDDIGNKRLKKLRDNPFLCTQTFNIKIQEYNPHCRIV